MKQRTQTVREGSTYYWGRRLFHLSAASIIPLLGLAVGYDYALALAIILRLYRNRSSVNVDEIDLMKW